MSHLNDEIVARNPDASTVAETKTLAAAASIKDTGRVKVGGTAIRFTATRDAGRVKVGGTAIRFNTRDAGRVKVGGTAIRF